MWAQIAGENCISLLATFSEGDNSVVADEDPSLAPRLILFCAGHLLRRFVPIFNLAHC
jgi:hypothetical protein